MGRNRNQRSRKKRMVIILSPHPDDLELSTALLCNKLKNDYFVIEVVVTDGAAGGFDSKCFWTELHIKRRREEATKAAAIVGIDKVIFLDFPDGRLNDFWQIAQKNIFDILSEYKPKIICFPSSLDMHSDHQTTNRIALSYLKKNKNIYDLQYCFWGKDNRINYRIKLDRPSKIKQRALKEYVSQPIDKYIKKFPNILKEELFYSEKGF